MYTDIHQHIVYGVDDGPAAFEAMCAMLLAAQKNGVSNLIATAHITPGARAFPLDQYLNRLAQARAWCAAQGIALSLYPGMEILFTDETARLLDAGAVLTLVGTRRVLVEFLPNVAYERVLYAARTLGNAGYTMVMAHFERCDCLRKLDRVAFLRDEYGVWMQMNAGTLLRRNGLFANYLVQKAMGRNSTFADCGEQKAIGKNGTLANCEAEKATGRAGLFADRGAERATERNGIFAEHEAERAMGRTGILADRWVQKATGRNGFFADYGTEKSMSRTGLFADRGAERAMGRTGILADRWVQKAMRQGLIDVVASDAHNVSTRPCRMDACYQAIKAQYGAALAETLCISAPQTLLHA